VKSMLGQIADAAALSTGLQKSRRGQALLELTVITPFILMLILLAMNFGAWLHAWTQVGNAARAAANFAALGTASAGSPIMPHGTDILAMLSNDLGTLPNYSSTNPAVDVCWNNNGTISSITGTCSSPPADPEAGSYIAVSVDLTYTFTPLFVSIPTLRILLPALPTSIHRRIVMRQI
jgi:Flp pilus assembly protein TadG